MPGSRGTVSSTTGGVRRMELALENQRRRFKSGPAIVLRRAVMEAIMEKVLIAVLALALLGGCSTMNSSYNPDDDLDLAYIAYVENAAKQLGTRVIWVNSPRKPAASK
jgi:hypothetical protein